MTQSMKHSLLIIGLIAVACPATAGAAAALTAPQTTAQPTAVAPSATRAPAVAPMIIPSPPAFGVLPGQFAIRTMSRNTYLTARDGGHHSIDAVVTTATTAGPNEKFTFQTFQPSYTLIKTAGGYYVSAAGAGGLGANYDETQILQTERTALADDALFKMFANIPGYSAFTVQTYKGYYLTALGGGGKPTRAFHTDAVKPSGWEYYWVSKCGDLGSAYDYSIFSKGTPGLPMTVTNGGGLVKNAISFGGVPATARFKLIRQNDGSYALQTSNRINYVTAINGGGLASGTATWDNLVTDRTQVQAWETFRMIDQGNCTYTIRTTNNWYLATAPGRISTRISDPAAAAGIGYNAYFELIPYLLQ